MVAGLSSQAIRAAIEEYERLRPTVERKYPGQYIVIDPISKDYFIGQRLAEALRTAMGKYPDRQFYSMKIGSQSAIVFS